MRITFAEAYSLRKIQSELDFVDVPVNGSDVRLFIDPFSLSKRTDGWFFDASNTVVRYFKKVLGEIRKGNRKAALELLDGLHESNETKLGYSPSNKGRAVGRKQSLKLYYALKSSKAFRTGLLRDLEECNLFIEGINRDKVSDITTNIIKSFLIQYTKDQCELLGINDMRSCPIRYVLNPKTLQWENDYYLLPHYLGKPIVLVPKSIVRIIPTINSPEYYQHYVLNFLQENLYSARDALCRVLKDGQVRPPTKKVIGERITRVGTANLESKKVGIKDYIYDFTLRYPHILESYKNSKLTLDLEESNETIESKNKKRKQNIQKIIDELTAIPAGKADANRYHNHIVGALIAIFYPQLSNPCKEHPINEGRKRIDIKFNNSASYGFFRDIYPIKGVKAPYIFFECKNYHDDPKNPEIDQLATRLSPRRGHLGFLICREVSDKSTLLNRCKDILREEHGYIIVLTDEDIVGLLSMVKNKNTSGINTFFEDKWEELVS